MIKHLFFFVAVFFCIGSYSQNETTPHIHSGIDRFILGTPKAAYDTALILAEGGAFTWKGVTTFTYQYKPLRDHPLHIQGLLFPSVLLTFNEANELLQIDCFTVYRNAVSARYLKDFKRDCKRLVTYLNTAWNKKGVKKTEFNNKDALHTRYEWYAGNRIMILSASTNHISQFASISLSLGPNYKLVR